MSPQNMDREPRTNEQQQKDLKKMRDKTGKQKQENRDEETDSGCGC